FCQAEDGIRGDLVTGVQTCALPICAPTPGIEAGERGPEDHGASDGGFPKGELWGSPAMRRLASHGQETAWRSTGGQDTCALHIRSEERRVGKECSSREAMSYCKKTG